MNDIRGIDTGGKNYRRLNDPVGPTNPRRLASVTRIDSNEPQRNVPMPGNTRGLPPSLRLRPGVSLADGPRQPGLSLNEGGVPMIPLGGALNEPLSLNVRPPPFGINPRINQVAPMGGYPPSMLNAGGPRPEWFNRPRLYDVSQGAAMGMLGRPTVFDTGPTRPGASSDSQGMFSTSVGGPQGINSSNVPNRFTPSQVAQSANAVQDGSRVKRPNFTSVVTTLRLSTYARQFAGPEWVGHVLFGSTGQRKVHANGQLGEGPMWTDPNPINHDALPLSIVNYLLAMDQPFVNRSVDQWHPLDVLSRWKLLGVVRGDAGAQMSQHIDGIAPNTRRRMVVVCMRDQQHMFNYWGDVLPNQPLGFIIKGVSITKIFAQTPHAHSSYNLYASQPNVFAVLPETCSHYPLQIVPWSSPDLAALPAPHELTYPRDDGSRGIGVYIPFGIVKDIQELPASHKTLGCAPFSMHQTGRLSKFNVLLDSNGDSV